MVFQNVKTNGSLCVNVRMIDFCLKFDLLKEEDCMTKTNEKRLNKKGLSKNWLLKKTPKILMRPTYLWWFERILNWNVNSHFEDSSSIGWILLQKKKNPCKCCNLWVSYRANNCCNPIKQIFIRNRPSWTIHGCIFLHLAGLLQTVNFFTFFLRIFFCASNCTPSVPWVFVFGQTFLVDFSTRNRNSA